MIFKEKSGIISKKECWVAIFNEYLYTAETLDELLYILYTEWEHDKHLVG